MFSTKGLRTLSACLIKATQGRVTDFRCFSVMHTFMIRQTNVSHTFGKLLKATLTALFCLWEGVSSALQSLQLYPDVFIIHAFPLALVYCMASHLFWRGLNIHSRINSGYYSCSSAIPMFPIQHTWPALVTRVDQHCITLTNEKIDAHLWYMTAAELFCLRSIRNKAKHFTVHPKVKTLRLCKM